MSKFQQHIKYLKYSLDPSAFMKDILNWECKDFHKEWLDFMANNKKTVLLAPRSHGKTTTLIAYLIWKILVNPDIRMLYMTIKEDKAMEVSDKIMYQLSSNEKLIDIFGEQKGDLWSRRAFNVKNRKHSSANRAPTFTACGIESREIGAHFDLIALDDIVDKENTNTQHRMDNLKETFDSVIDYMLEPNGEIHVIGCLHGDTNILMADGTWKKIKDIKIGEKVKSFKNNSLVDREVIWSGCVGDDIVYEINTGSAKIIANSIHPFLVMEPKKVWGRGKRVLDFDFRWKKVSELKNGDLILNLNTKPDGQIPDFEFKIDKDFMWLYGYLMGDGWVTKWITDDRVKYMTTISYTNKTNELQMVKDLWVKIFDYKLKTLSNKNLASYQGNVGKFLHDNNLGLHAKGKFIPDWVFKAPLEYRRQFIFGLLRADGTKLTRGNGYKLELSNEKLIKQVQLLARISGFRVSNTFTRDRLLKAPNSKSEEIHTFYSIYIFLNSSYRNGRFIKKAIDKFPLDNFNCERIVSIKKIGVDKVYDLTVEDTHNFITEGLVTHNTKWHENDLYSNLKEYTDFKFRRYQGIIQWEDKEKGIPGKSLWPERYPYEELAKKLKDKGAYLFYLQTQNEVISQEHAMFKSEFMNNEFDLSNIDISSLKRYMGIDLASSTGKDYFTIVTIGLDKNGIIYILDAFRGKLGINQQLEKVKEKDELWKPIKIGVESNSYQAAFSTELLTTTALPIVPVNVKRSKIDRAQRAATLLEAGRIYFRRSGMDELKKELAFFPNGKNDDLVDALTMAINIIDTKRFNSTWSDVADAIWAGNVSSKVNTTNLELI